MLILLNLKEVLKATGMSRVHLWGLIKKGRFPASLRLSDEIKHLYFRQDQIRAWIKDHNTWKRACAKRARPQVGTGPDDRTNAADMGGIHATLESMLERADRQDAEVVKLSGMLAAVTGRVHDLERAVPSETPEPSPAVLPVDPSEPSETNKIAMRKRLRSRTVQGIEAHRKDPTYAAGPITRELSE